MNGIQEVGGSIPLNSTKYFFYIFLNYPFNIVKIPINRLLLTPLVSLNILGTLMKFLKLVQYNNVV